MDNPNSTTEPVSLIPEKYRPACEAFIRVRNERDPAESLGQIALLASDYPLDEMQVDATRQSISTIEALLGLENDTFPENEIRAMIACAKANLSDFETILNDPED